MSANYDTAVAVLGTLKTLYAEVSKSNSDNKDEVLDWLADAETALTAALSETSPDWWS